MDLNKYKTTTLYFTAGAVPTEAEMNEARELSRNFATNIRIRNGSAPMTGGVEKCDSVAGTTIPNAYLLAFPKVGEVSNEATTETEPTDPAGTPGSAPGVGEGSQSSAPSLAAEVGSVSGGWGSPT
jgi:hypothetical protein